MDEQILISVLSEPHQRVLFRRMSPNDQRHSLGVCQTLHQAGHSEHSQEGKALLAAALLHDVGKAQARMWLWQRVAIVLLERCSPAVLDWLARGEPHGWRNSFVVHRQHPQIGAGWAQAANCSPLTMNLIRRHQERCEQPQSREDQLLQALQWADGMN